MVRRRGFQDFFSYLDIMGNINSDFDDSYIDGERSSWDDDDYDDPYADDPHNPYIDEPWDGYSRSDHSPGYSNGVNLTLGEEEANPHPLSLFDLAARVSAKHVSCEEMEQHQPPLDEALLKRVAFWASPQNKEQVRTYAEVTLRGDNSWHLGERMFQDSKVQDMRQVGFMVTAVVTSSNNRGVVETAKVSFTFEKQRITSSSCESCPKKIWCSHLIAAILHRIKHAKMIPIHAPVTETLSTLSREQLQKLVQYAINEDPGGVLGKVFRRIDQIRDVSSEINETAGAPDPTFGLGLEGKSTWDLSMEDLKESFKSACLRASYDFPYSYDENRIEMSSFYRNYLKRVVDFVQKEEIEAAGRILIVLATAATEAISGASLSKNSRLLLKLIERLCSLYILQFTGQARSDLIILCQKLNRTAIVSAVHSNWAELTPVSLLFPHESKDVPGVLGARQRNVFYEPLCVSITQDPSEDFSQLISGTVEPPESNYDEPLPLMLARFEAIRQWRQPGKGERELLRLGAVILRKLLRMTYQFSILREQDRVKKAKETKKEKLRKRKSMNEAGDAGKNQTPAKRSKLKGRGDQPKTPVKDNEYETPSKKRKGATPAKRSKTETPELKRRSMRLQRRPQYRLPDPGGSRTPAGSTCTDAPSTSNSNNSPSTSARASSPSLEMPSTSSHSETESTQNERKKPAHGSDKLTESENLKEFVDSEPKSPTKQGEAPAAVDQCLTEDCLGNGKEEEMESYPKETLSYCLLHVCQCIYNIKDFNCLNKVEDNEVLASATLRALELARYRTVAENGQEVSIEEHTALNILEKKLVDMYREYKDKMLTRSFSYMLHRLYMKMLCECNNNGECFFDRGLPLVLISFLVRNTLKNDLGPENKHRARCLCWYTLCHSYKPLRSYTIPHSDAYYEYRRIFGQLEGCFSDIVSTFLNHLRSYPARNSWLLKLLKHYEKVRDGKALSHLWNELRLFPYGSESDEVQVAVVKFLLNCISRHNNKKAAFNTSSSTMVDMMDVLCRRLGPKFTEIVLVAWEDMIKFFRPSQLTMLVSTMKGVHTFDKPLSKEMVNVIMKFFSGKFKHDVDSCELLEFFSPGSEEYKKSVGLIRENASNYSPSALLLVGRKQMEHQSKDGRLSPSSIFSTEVELFINCALHVIGMSNKTDNFYYSDRNLIQGVRNEDVQWVFKAFLEKPAEDVAKSRQFSDLLDLLDKTFSTDLPTILSLFECVEDRQPLLEKCRLKFGWRIVELVNSSVFRVLDQINHSSYNRVLLQLETIHGYYKKYVTDGEVAFTKLLGNMKRVYKTKRKLVSLMDQFFPDLMQKA